MTYLHQSPTVLAAQSYSEKFYQNHGDNIILVKNPKIDSYSKNPFKSGYYILIICKKGAARGKVNLISHEIQGPGILIIRPEQLLQIEEYSKDFEGYLLLAKEEYLDSMHLNVAEIIPMKFLMRLYSGPYIPMSQEDIDSTISYFNLIFRTISLTDHPFLEASLAGILSSFIYEAGYYVSKNMEDVSIPEQDPIMDRLLLLIKRHFKEHRDVAFYAEKMHFTSNYLYKIVKRTSGKTVSDWIELYTISEAKSMLRNPKIPIQDISDMLNFSSMSFFGKYFKRVAGVTPKDYRQSIIVHENND